MLSKATPGTGMWLVKGEKFRLWLEPNGDIKIFWGSGMLGAGKTILVSIVIEYLEALSRESDGAICVCYIFFRFSDRAEVTVRNILEILVKQTLERHPECHGRIEQAYSQHLREHTEPTEAQLLSLLRELAASMACTFYVLDALDEAPRKIQLAIVKTLASLNVKLFITSRPLGALEISFPEAFTFTIIAQDTDLDLYIANGIDESEDLQHVLRTSGPSFREEIVSTVKQNCRGMFLYAALQLEELHECVTPWELRQTLKAFPYRIEDAYRQTWHRILGQGIDSILLAKAVLVWVLNASRSMTLEELVRAVATSPDTHRFEPGRVVPGATLVSLCCGLVTLEEESRIVRLVHYTAKETLGGLLSDSFPHPHSLLAAVCMAHLAECGFQNTTIRSEEEFKAALEKDPLLAYASEAWAVHAHNALDVEETRHQTAQFVSDIKAFPTFTSPDRSSYFDIITSLHILGLCNLPLALIEGSAAANPNVKTQILQQTPLMLASWLGHEDFVAHLAALPGTQVNFVDTDGWSALMRAAHAGHRGIVRLLLAHPVIQVNLVDNEGWSALLRAAHAGHEGSAKFLLAHPETLVNLVNNEGSSALMLAAHAGNEGSAKLLLAHPEIQVNLVDNRAYSALMWAAHAGNGGSVKLLLAHPEIQVNLVDNEGYSALMRAARAGYESIVNLLLSHPKIQVNIFDSKGSSALMLAAHAGNEGSVKLLLAHPETLVNLVDTEGSSALMLAALAGHEGVVTLFLAQPEIQVNLADVDGRSALLRAAHAGHHGVVMLLRAHTETQVNLVDSEGSSALTLAAYAGHEGIVKLLLTHPGIKRDTPLICLLGTKSAKAPLLHDLSRASFIRHTEALEGVKGHEGVEVHTLSLDDTVSVTMASLPAFENDNVERNLAVCETLFNFFHYLEARTCNTVIMAYDLSRPRLQHCDPLNFRLVEDLCGPGFFAKNLAIITTNWDSDTPEEAEHLESRESDLRSRESCFKDFLERGAQCHRHDDKGSAPTVELLRSLASQSPMPLSIQEEVSANPTFNRTRIGGVMAQRLRAHLKMVSERSDLLKAELAEGRWVLDEDEQYAMERDQEALEQTWVRLNRILEEL